MKNTGSATQSALTAVVGSVVGTDSQVAIQLWGLANPASTSDRTLPAVTGGHVEWGRYLAYILNE